MKTNSSIWLVLRMCICVRESLRNVFAAFICLITTTRFQVYIFKARQSITAPNCLPVPIASSHTDSPVHRSNYGRHKYQCPVLPSLYVIPLCICYFRSSLGNCRLYAVNVSNCDEKITPSDLKIGWMARHHRVPPPLPPVLTRLNWSSDGGNFRLCDNNGNIAVRLLSRGKSEM